MMQRPGFWGWPLAFCVGALMDHEWILVWEKLELSMGVVEQVSRGQRRIPTRSWRETGAWPADIEQTNPLGETVPDVWKMRIARKSAFLPDLSLANPVACRRSVRTLRERPDEAAKWSHRWAGQSYLTYYGQDGAQKNIDPARKFF